MSAADAYGALESALIEITSRLACDRLMADELGSVGLGDPESTRRIERILKLRVEQGTLRPDATGMDIRVLVAGTAGALLELKVTDPEVWNRYARLALAALRR